AREPLDRFVGFPGIQLALEPFGPLRLALSHIAHARLRKNKSRTAARVRSSGFCLRLRLIASALPRSLRHVPQRYLNPRFTARALCRDAAGRGFHSQDRVANDDLRLAVSHDLRAADWASPVLGRRRRHGETIYF